MKEAEARGTIHMVTDCKSLYDHVHREGAPKAPSDKRLAIDIADLRGTLVQEGMQQWVEKHGADTTPSPDKPCRPPLHWLPTTEQLADCLTKRLKVDDWWQDVNAPTLKLPFKM